MGISTKKGDDGITGLPNTSERVPKDDPLIEYLGTLDELDAILALGEISLKSDRKTETAALVAEIRQKLTDIMAVNTAETAKNTQWLEQQIARAEKEMPIRDFIRSWSNNAAAYLNTARTICRRAERRLITALLDSTVIEKNIAKPVSAADWKIMLPFLNRLSDLLFLLAVSENDK